MVGLRPRSTPSLLRFIALHFQEFLHI
jgi:hypothetical protein